MIFKNAGSLFRQPKWRDHGISDVMTAVGVVDDTVPPTLSELNMEIRFTRTEWGTRPTLGIPMLKGSPTVPKTAIMLMR